MISAQPLKEAYLYVHVAVAVCGRAIISICTLTISYFTLDLLMVQKSTPAFTYVLNNLNVMTEQLAKHSDGDIGVRIRLKSEVKYGIVVFCIDFFC